MTKLVFIILAAATAISVSAETDDFQIVKDRVIAELIKDSIGDRSINTMIDKMNNDGSFSDINYTDLSRTAGFPQEKHTSNLVYLAKAYSNEASTFYQSKKPR